MAQLTERRAFLRTSLKAAGITAILSLPREGNTKVFTGTKKDYTVQDVMDIILKEIPGAPFKQTVDTLKSGSAGQTVTGIVTTMFATVKIIEEAAKLKANFIIAHEPTFYNHTDDVNWVTNSDVVKQKEALLKQHGIAVWRFHDYWHSYRPDGIRHGVLKKAGWLDYYKDNGPMVEIPSTGLKQLAEHLKSSLGIKQVRVIGDLNQPCKRIALLPGASGGQMQMGVMEKQHPDVLVVGEVHEWETAEYVRDSVQLGSKTALIVLGHSVSEEPGMEWLVDWLKPKVPGLAVTHIESGNPFVWI